MGNSARRFNGKYTDKKGTRHDLNIKIYPVVSKMFFTLDLLRNGINGTINTTTKIN